MPPARDGDFHRRHTTRIKDLASGEPVEGRAACVHRLCICIRHIGLHVLRDTNSGVVDLSRGSQGS